jgi:hypothetical protein
MLFLQQSGRQPAYVTLGLMDKWESIAGRKVREAMERGEFDNLPDKGKPIPLDRNPFEDPSMWTAHHLLQVNGFAPAWIEEAREIDAEVARFQAMRSASVRPNAEEFRKQAVELNRRILAYNLKCPSAQFHRRMVEVGRGAGQTDLSTRGDRNLGPEA